jgi:hypothetical protein
MAMRMIASSDESCTGSSMSNATNKMSALAPISVADDHIDE